MKSLINKGIYLKLLLVTTFGFNPEQILLWLHTKGDYMNYCIHLKKRKNKPYCNVIKEEIPFSRCRECGNKEYKKCTEFKKNSAKKSTLKGKSPVKSGTKMQQCKLEYCKTHNNKKMRVKSKELAKLERNRFSVLTDDLEHCILCGKKKNDLHEVFGGRNRLNSIKYNLVLPLCRECHSLNQSNPFFNDYWHRQGQEYFECNIGTRDDFIRIFRRNYLN